MLIFNGKKYAKNDSEFVESLFDASGTCNGYYKRLKDGVQLFNMQRELTAFIVDRTDRARFVVSAGMHDGKARYMHGLSSAAEQWLGVAENTFARERQMIANMRFV
jgi:hypothetical protein